ncbi:MAG TPA: DedA family protein [Xanthobacteraceae bacterium]|jgi:membrane protein DedA with SNARE-associated domain|nr:DedA family protein [Xanthobacteraceae bacterium]
MEWLAGFAADFEQLVRDYGVIAVMIIITLESVGAPVPGETLLIFAAFLAARGEMSLPALAAAAWAGSVIGDNIGYLIGRKVGRAAIANFGSKVGLTEERFAKVEAVFVRYGGATVIFARFFSILRQLNGIVAGTLGMDWRRFLACNSIGAALWVGVWVLGSYYMAEHADRIRAIGHSMGSVGALASAAVGAALAVYFVLRRTRRPA